MIGRHLIDMVDEAGYLSGDFDGLSRLLNCPPERIEATLAKLRGFDPSGVFARKLSECLALQLKDRNRLDPVMQMLLDNLDLLAKHGMAALRRLCRVADHELAEMIAQIKALNPKPGLAFDTAGAQSVTPDVLMRADTNGGWILELNSETLPRVLVNTQYYTR